MKKLLTLLFAIITTLTAHAQSIEGSWTGKLSVGNASLRLVFHFSKGDNGLVTGKMDSPDQGATGIPTEVVSSDPTKIEVAIAMLGVTYKGQMDGDEIKGTFTQNGYTFSLDLKRGNVERKRPQEPKPPYPYDTEDVTFRNTQDSVALSGTITYPIGYSTAQAQSAPVVVMVTGSGQQDRDETLLGHKPFLVIADHLARNGIASLRYDDRGMGKSAGDAIHSTTYNNMCDAEAALSFLRQTGKFGKSGIIGHSEGGEIAFMLGAKGVADFIVTLAAPGMRGDSILMEQNRQLLKQSGDEMTAQKFLSGLRLFYDEIINGNDLHGAVAHLEERVGLKMPEGFANEFGTPWMNYFLRYDPSDAIRSTRCPVFALNGTLDTQVLSATNLATIRRLLPTNEQNLIKEYAGLNHLFQHCTTGLASEYGQIEETIATDVLEDISKWINGVSK